MQNITDLLKQIDQFAHEQGVQLESCSFVFADLDGRGTKSAVCRFKTEWMQSTSRDPMGFDIMTAAHHIKQYNAETARPADVDGNVALGRKPDHSREPYYHAD